MKRGAEESRRWLDQAKEDLKWAARLAEEGGYHIACFLAQQVAEKALKSYLYLQGEEAVMGHSVVRLCRSASAYEEVFRDKAKDWGILDTYYIPTRYPNGLPDGIPAEAYNEAAAKSAVSLADEVVGMVEAIASGEIGRGSG